MTTRPHWMNVTGILPGMLVVTVAASVVLATVVLEMFALRLEGGGSLTTMFPGFVYTNVLILKVSLVEAAVLFLTSIASRMPGWSAMDDRSRVPSAGIASVFLPTFGALVGAIVVVVVQAFTDLPNGAPSNYFSQLSRTGVLVVVAIISLGALTAVYSLLRKERPTAIALIGLLTSFAYLITILYWEFYKLGFDQDRWNAS